MERQLITRNIVTFTAPLATNYELVKKMLNTDRFLEGELDKFIDKIHLENSKVPNSKKIEIFHRENNILVTEKDYVFCVFQDMI